MTGVAHAMALALAAPCAGLAPPSAVEHAALQKCTRCHRQGLAGPADLLELDAALCRRGAGLVEAMLEEARTRLADFGAADADAVRLRWAAAQAQDLAAGQGQAQKPRFLLLDAAENERLVSLLPRGALDDAGGRSLERLHRRAPVFYDESVMPKAVQVDAGDGGANSMYLESPAAVDHPRRDAASGAFASDRGGLEFPWLSPAGLDARSEVQVHRFVVPPPTGPMLQLKRIDRAQSRALYGKAVNEAAWLHGFLFLPGTIFGEALTARDPETGATLSFEVRLREVQADGRWLFDVLRPFRSPIELRSRLIELFPRWQADPPLQAFLTQMSAPTPPVVERLDAWLTPFALARNARASTALSASAAVSMLPGLPPRAVRKLLGETPFRSVMGTSWGSAVADPASTPIQGFAARGAGAFHIFPSDYRGTHLALSSSQCVRCHEDTQRHVDNFTPPPAGFGGETGLGREWFGHLPGSTPQASGNQLPASGIFSFHPFQPESVAQGKFQQISVFSNARLEEAGLVRR